MPLTDFRVMAAVNKVRAAFERLNRHSTPPQCRHQGERNRSLAGTTRGSGDDESACTLSHSCTAFLPPHLEKGLTRQPATTL
jgi:hypothetical protein